MEDCNLGSFHWDFWASTSEDPRLKILNVFIWATISNTPRKINMEPENDGFQKRDMFVSLWTFSTIPEIVIIRPRTVWFIWPFSLPSSQSFMTLMPSLTLSCSSLRRVTTATLPIHGCKPLRRLKHYESSL